MPKRHLPVGDGHFRAIGRITVFMEYLHAEIQFWTWELIGAEQRIGQILTAGAAFSATVRTFGALAHERLPTGDYARLAPLLKEALRLEKRRNQIVHSIWGGGGDAPHRFKMRSHVKGIRFESDERLTATDLEGVGDAIERLTLRLQRLFIDLGTAAATSQSSTPTPSP